MEECRALSIVVQTQGMSEDTNHTSPFQHHHPRTQPIKANHKYYSPICIQPSLRALVSNGYAIPSNVFGLGSFYPSPYPSMCPCPTQKDGRPLNQTNAAWDMIFAVRESGGKKGEWMEVHTFYLKEVLDYHASHTKRTPVTTNYPCPLSRPTSAGFACLTCKCHRKK